MDYKEPISSGNPFRTEYQNSIERLVCKRREQFDKISLENAARFKNGDKLRNEFTELLGWPLTEYSFSVPNVRKIKVAESGGITVYRIQIEALPDFWFYGILFVREDGIARPLVIAQHGGDGTPELCSSLEPNGSSNYNDMSERLLRQDVNVFAPQLLLWSVKKYFPESGKEDLQRHQLDNRLKQCGGSITALEIYCLRKSLDWLCVQPFVIPDKIGMAGLSYGGFYTLYTAAADTRIKAALSCSFFNDRGIYCWNDWVFQSKQSFFDPEVAMLCCPRPLFIAVGENDPLFLADSARAEAERLRALSVSAYGSADWFSFYSFDGGHEFIKNDELLLRFIREIRGKE